MLAAYTNTSFPIRAVINLYGPGDLTGLYNEPPTPDPLQVAAKLRDLFGGKPTPEASPIAYLHSDIPPTLHIQGASDRIVQARLTRDLHARALAIGARSELLELPWSDHSFDFVYFGPGNIVALDAIERFLHHTFISPSSDRDSPQVNARSDNGNQ